MSAQIRYGLTFGSGQDGVDREKRFRAAAGIEGRPLARWIIETLEDRAGMILSQKQSLGKSAQAV